jgi:hypothetical protein
MLPDKFREQYSTYLQDWVRAEEVLKMAERLKNEVFIPSIMELRYAARRVVQAELDFANGYATDDEIGAHLTEAIENCRKARHDAIDSAVNFVHEQLDVLKDNVGLPVLVQAFPGYAALRARINEIDERIVASRKNRAKLDDEYEAIKREHLTQIVDLYRQMECSRPAIESIIKKQKWDFVQGVILVGLVVGIAGSSLVTVADKQGVFNAFSVQANKPTEKINSTDPASVKTTNAGSKGD